jgi:NAD(P)-dependent dehydrogenase (short-subunit alcohol dehydrogenase family)
MKTWLITGISRGLGKALAEAALARGDKVVGTTRDGRSDVEGAIVLPLEMTDSGGIDKMIAAAFAQAGTFDVIVNNAGYGLLGAVEDAREEDIERLFAVDLFGPFRLIRAALPHLRRQKSGHIINITSIAGRAPGAGSAFYAAAKFGLEGFSQSLAQEVAPFGIKVTSVAPGAFRTDFLSSHSIRKSAPATEGYGETAGKMLDAFDRMDGRQLGDPVKAAEAILELADSEKPPVQLLLGSDAWKRLRARQEVADTEMAEWRAVTLGTDHSDGN